jgi:hypothetical protein
MFERLSKADVYLFSNLPTGRKIYNSKDLTEVVLMTIKSYEIFLKLMRGFQNLKQFNEILLWLYWRGIVLF